MKKGNKVKKYISIIVLSFVGMCLFLSVLGLIVGDTPAQTESVATAVPTTEVVSATHTPTIIPTTVPEVDQEFLAIDWRYRTQSWLSNCGNALVDVGESGDDAFTFLTYVSKANEACVVNGKYYMEHPEEIPTKYAEVQKEFDSEVINLEMAFSLITYGVLNNDMDAMNNGLAYLEKANKHLNNAIDLMNKIQEAENNSAG